MRKLILITLLFTFAFGLMACQEVTATGLVVTPPTQVEYRVGDTFNPAGLAVKMLFSDGTEEVIAAQDYGVSGFDSTTPGLKMVTVTYGEETETFSVAVLEQLYAPIPPMASYVEKSSPEDMLADIPAGGVVYQKDFTVETPITSFTYEFNGSNMLTYVIPDVGTIESRGFNNEDQLPKVVRQDEEGLHFNVTRIGDWSGNGEFRLTNLIPGHLQVTAGAFYEIYIEAKWVGAGDDGRLLRIVYAGRDASNETAALYGTEFSNIKHHEVFLPGIAGEPAQLNNTERIDLRVGWTGAYPGLGLQLQKQVDVDQTMVLKSITVVRGATSSMHTTTPDGYVKAFAIGGQDPIYDGSFMSLLIDKLGDNSQLPAVVFTGLQLIHGKTYDLQFDHEALRRRSVEVFIGYYDEWGRLVPLKDAPVIMLMDSYSSRITTNMTFEWEGESIHDAFLVFSYGDVGEYNALTTIKVGNVSLVESIPS